MFTYFFFVVVVVCCSCRLFDPVFDVLPVLCHDVSFDVCCSLLVVSLLFFVVGVPMIASSVYCCLCCCCQLLTIAIKCCGQGDVSRASEQIPVCAIQPAVFRFLLFCLFL